MNDISTLHSYRCDLNTGPCEVELHQPLMHQDALADAFSVTVCRGAQPVNLTGMTVYGYLYFDATRQTLPIPGTISEHTASVTFIDECYAVPGWCSLVIQLRQGDARHTVLKVNFAVKRTGSDNLYLPGSSPTLADLIARIEELEKGGVDGEDGGYYTPSVDESTGELTWSPSKDDMPALDPANIKGPKGTAATIRPGTVTKLAPGSIPTVTNSGDEQAAVFNFGIPQGDKGDAATVRVGTVTTLPAGSQATVSNSGDAHDAVLNFGIPRGADGSNSEGGGGSSEGGGSGEDGGYYTPSVSDDGELTWTPSKADMPAAPSAIVKGSAGKAATVKIGTVTTGEAGTSASVNNVGTENDAVLNFSIPRGPAGYTPVKGTDYWTAADQQSMVNDVLAALPVYNGEVTTV